MRMRDWFTGSFTGWLLATVFSYFTGWTTTWRGVEALFLFQIIFSCLGYMYLVPIIQKIRGAR